MKLPLEQDDKDDDHSIKSNSNIHESSEYYSDDYEDSFDYFDFEIDTSNEMSTTSSDSPCIVDYDSFLMNQITTRNFAPSESTENQFHVLSGSTLDAVLQHLTLRDLKECSLVCKTWYRQITSIESALSKFKLKLDCYCDGDMNEFFELLQSDRDYSHVEMIVNNDDETMTVMASLLLKFAKSIRHLKLVKYGGHLNFLTKSIDFDKLETVELYASCSTMSTEFLSGCENLKKITLDGVSEKSLREILKKNPNVEELILYENGFITYLNLNLPNIFMNLKTFGYLDHMSSGFTMPGEFAGGDWTVSSREMMMKFLMYQSPTLQTLRLDKVYVDDMATILESLPLLKNLEINQIVGNMSTLRLPMNSSVEVFFAMKIHDLLLCEIVKNLKSLKSLFLHYVKSHQFIILWDNSVQLREFSYFWASSSERINGPFIELDRIVRNISHDGVSNETFKITRTTKKKFLNSLEI